MSHDETPTAGSGPAPAAEEPPVAPRPEARPDFLERATRILGGDVRPEDYLSVPPEVVTVVEGEVARLRTQEGIEVSDDFRTRLVNEWVLQYCYGGKPVACQRSEFGVVIFAVGAADIQRFLGHFPQRSERPRVVLTTPALWQPPEPTASPNL